MTEVASSKFSHSSTITDICCTEDAAEVELVSLLQEQIPHYKLRADTLTEFGGYENEDWFIKTPVLTPDCDLQLSPEVVEETLKYFVLCADRLSQMTKTYHDIDAVTRLLEEKERDLELAARIGQSLLEQNKDLRIRNELIEQELITANESVTQLRHDLAVKNGLLQIYTQDLDTESETGSPVREKSLVINWELLNKKISSLQEENNILRTEAFSRSSDIEKEEKKEMQLITDCVKQLGEANCQISYLQEEIAKKTEDNIRQQEEITQLLSQVVDLQRRLRDLTADNECLASKLEVAEECQHDLSEELIEMKEKYGELMAAFQELQADVKQAQRSRLPSANKFHFYGYNNSYLNPDSLALELEQSLGRDSDGYSSDGKSYHSRKVFDTVRYAHHGCIRRNRLNSSQSHYTMNSGCSKALTSSCFSSLSQLSSMSSGFNDLASDTESAYAESYNTDDEGQETYTGGKFRTSRPNVLDIGLTALSSGVESDLSNDSDGTCANRWTPNMKKIFYNRSFRRYQLPEKLQIIKPLEGSQTLKHWQRLATPHLGGIFESRPGVRIKGETKLKDFDERVSLADYEEDEEISYPGKSFMPTCSVYTFTTSSLQNLNALTSVTPSYPSLQVTTRVTSQPPSALNSPQEKPTFVCMSSGGQSLAKLLTQRGIHAMIPSVMSPYRKVTSPTPTPAPSPEGSPPSTPLPFTGVRIPDLVGSASIAKGFHLLKKQRRSRSQPPSKQNDRDSSSVNVDLMGQISKIGIGKLISADSSSSTVICDNSDSSKLQTMTDESYLSATSSSKCIDQIETYAEGEGLNIASTAKVLSPDFVMSRIAPPVAMVKSPAAIGLTPTVPPPLSRMPNPVLQLNTLRNMRPNSSDVGTVGTLRTLRKGGYI